MVIKKLVYFIFTIFVSMNFNANILYEKNNLVINTNKKCHKRFK